MSFPLEVSFNQVLEDYISGKLLKEQALELLENKYKTAYVDIKQKFGKDRQSFCCYIKYDFEKWIEICDGAERNKPFLERKYNDDKIQRVIENYVAECNKNDLESGDCIGEVYSEVHQIQNWCRENQETKKLYEKYKAEIEALPETIYQKTTEYLDTPEKIQTEIGKTIAILLKKNYIKKVNTKTNNIEYRITDKVPKLIEFLKIKKNNGEIKLPEIKDIDDFLIKHVRNKKGDTLSDAIRVNKWRKEKKNKSLRSTKNGNT
jgi:hypothetical protein